MITVLSRPLALLRRNVTFYGRYRLVLATGVLEPLLYLAGFGLGVGGLVGDVRTDAGSVVPYAEFVGPALLATAVMNGALIDTTLTLFYRLRFVRTYDSVLTTPLSTRDIVLGETAWVLTRGLLYGGAFVAILALAGLLPSPWALLALPAVLLVAWAFAGLGLAIVTLTRTWGHVDLVTQGVVLPLFLLSATFFPASTYPEEVRGGLLLSPLYHGVELVRSLCLGEVADPRDLAGHAVVLVAVGLVGMVVAHRRLAAQLLP